MENKIIYYNIPIELWRHLLDGGGSAAMVLDRVKRFIDGKYYRTETQIIEGASGIFFSIKKEAYEAIKEVADKPRELLAFLGFYALKSIAGKRRDTFISTSNGLFVARMAGFNKWDDLKAATGEEIGGTIYRLTRTTGQRQFQDNCRKIREIIAERYSTITFQPSPTNRGFEFKISKCTQQRGGFDISELTQDKGDYPYKIAPAEAYIERL